MGIHPNKRNPADHRLDRRNFMSRSAAAAFSIVPSSAVGAQGTPAPSQRINVAFIGLGGMGTGNLNEIIQIEDVQVTALCDVERGPEKGGERRGRGLRPALRLVEEHYAKQQKVGSNNDCATYVDFREMLDKETGIDAVVISTPDHVHAAACLAAIDQGKHIYCEKPLTHSIYETRRVTEAARKAGVATQMGNHGHSGEGIRLTVEWLQAGAIGPVREVHGWTVDGGLSWTQFTERPEETPPVPNTLDWDGWIGPAPARPYHPAYAPYNWRGWWDFGSGAIGDMACHNLDPAFWALELGSPTSVEATSTRLSDETVPAGALYHYEYPARGEMPPVTMKWYDGGLMPQRPRGLKEGRRIGEDGIYFVGDEGVILCGGWGGAPRIIPESKMATYQRPPKTIPRVEGHHQDWINACKGGTPASSNFDYAGPLTETVLLGNVALRSGKKLYWDVETMKATNAPEADAFVRPEFRSGWGL